MSSPIVLDRASFLAPTSRRFGEFLWPGRGVVRYRNLTELERSRFEVVLQKEGGGISEARLVDMRCRLIAAAVVGPEGELLFSKADVQSLMELDGAIIGKLYDAIRAHCGYDEGDLEALVKNSSGTPAEDSLSA